MACIENGRASEGEEGDIRVSDTYTIPEMELTPEKDGKVRATMNDGVFTFLSRAFTRHVLSGMGLGVPEWLRPDRDPKS